MSPEKLMDLPENELLQKAKNSKLYIKYDAVIIGLLIGISIYSSVKNGFGLLTFLPLVYLPAAAKNRKNKALIDKALQKRNLL
ncbi:MAG: hypothetical protein ACPGLV_04815 [Bacteroidia bacterium]